MKSGGAASSAAAGMAAGRTTRPAANAAASTAGRDLALRGIVAPRSSGRYGRARARRSGGGAPEAKPECDIDVKAGR
ncbi:hypothetical protein GCM10022222_53970 [Amycolatopsis ultiminotia]|uniref:Uncharacterized protein n=1 Tax=Amycolatopsis ultiminotia TaxID=543629 RepID=A0ABP6X9L0_9PSEU